jgi:uncharacterized OsmC-like protein
MKNAPKRWSVNALCDGMSRISYFCDGRPLASDSHAERETLSPVQHLLVGLAGCFALSCQAIFLKKRLKGIGLEVVVTGEKSASPHNRLSAILVSAIFHGDLTSSEAAAVVEEAKPSEALLERSQIEFMRPRAARLLMEMPIGVRDRGRIEQATLAGRSRSVGCAGAQTLAVDSSVNDDVGDMDILRAILPRRALSQRA